MSAALQRARLFLRAAEAKAAQIRAEAARDDLRSRRERVAECGHEVNARLRRGVNRGNLDD